jgi:hypothetical protein
MARTASRCSRFGAERDQSIGAIMKPESPNQSDRANRRQPLGFREQVVGTGVSGFTAAVAHPGRSATEIS